MTKRKSSVGVLGMLGMKSQLASRLIGGMGRENSKITCRFPAWITGGMVALKWKALRKNASEEEVHLIQIQLEVPVER